MQELFCACRNVIRLCVCRVNTLIVNKIIILIIKEYYYFNNLMKIITNYSENNNKNNNYTYETILKQHEL